MSSIAPPTQCLNLLSQHQATLEARSGLNLETGEGGLSDELKAQLGYTLTNALL